MGVEKLPDLEGHFIDGIGPYPVGHEYTYGSVQPIVLTDDGLVSLQPEEYSIDPDASKSSTSDGNVILTEAAAATHDGRTMYLVRVTEARQVWEAVYSPREVSLQEQLNRITMGLQDLERQLASTLRTPTPRGPVGAFDGAPADRGDMMLAFSPDGTSLVTGPTTTTVAGVNADAHAAAASQTAAASSALAASQSEQASRFYAEASQAPMRDTVEEGRALVADGDLHLQLVGRGVKVWRRLDAANSDFVAWRHRPGYDDPAALLGAADTYGPDEILTDVVMGLAWATLDEGGDVQMDNGAGQHLRPMYSAGKVWHAEAFGIFPGIGVNHTARFNAMIAAASREGAKLGEGGAPNVFLPAGVINLDPSALALPSGIQIIGQGPSIASTGSAGPSTYGTYLNILGTGTVFTSGQDLHSQDPGSVNVKIANLTIGRDDLYINTSADTALIQGHRPARWTLEHVHFRPGRTAAWKSTEAWDLFCINCEIVGGGQPDGDAAITMLNSNNSSANTNSSKFIGLRIEKSNGMMMDLRGNHHHIQSCKFHAGSNLLGGALRPAIRIDSHTPVIGCQLVNFQGPGTTVGCDTFIEIIGLGCTITGNNFRNNGALPSLIRIEGTNAFHGRHVIGFNDWDEGGLNPLSAILDNREGNGPTCTLGPEETYRYSGPMAGQNVAAANMFARFYAGGTPAFAGTIAYFRQNENNKGPGLHVVYSPGFGAADGDVALLAESGNYQRSVAVIRQTRTTGATEPELLIETGKLGTDGRDFIEGVTDYTGAPTTGFRIRHDGAYFVGADKVIGARQPAIANVTTTVGTGAMPAVTGSAHISNPAAPDPAELLKLIVEVKAHSESINASNKLHGLNA
ncbi:hypothetical protein CDO87_03385 [Sagittula sp. P11]|uniref:hypothetical protein n=1 Tax=Sagittula sp. P11 TaxID=2009329 RepID=UPI000C2D0D4D|nr:hypothetical protein [Sagittula sp. P11]AUC52288.1 hypothetical protein CDO87_03385 [Sagittula sp. P11]